MSARADSFVKVHAETWEKLREAAVLMGCSQAELVGRAVDEYVERHRKPFGERMDEAERVLLRGKSAVLAYWAGVSEADVERLGGAAERIGRVQKPGDAADRGR